MEGTVKWFRTEKGYGFITGEDGKDYFVHHKQVPQGVELEQGQKVEFEPVETDKGVQAQNIKVL
ncbi:cold shock domain-containing protein [Candidatus Woesearchaeota archaeon]|nr:cold shock domain-containing protein [Candidatus Woesearchaeota archaeon]